MEYNMDKLQGKLIAVEGIDGSGKTTQIEFLRQYLASKGLALRAWEVEVINFPRYGKNIYANLVTRYLEGEFGSIQSVNPYLIAFSFAGDRLLAKPLIENWLNEGKVVIANRYVSSSKAHLGANMDEKKREEFMEWIDQLEYQTNGMPKPDLTILLKVDPKVGQQNALKDHKVDIHEKNIQHEEKAAKIFFELSQVEENWVVVNCMENGQMRSKEEIQQEIMDILDSIIQKR